MSEVISSPLENLLQGFQGVLSSIWKICYRVSEAKWQPSEKFLRYWQLYKIAQIWLWLLSYGYIRCLLQYRYLTYSQQFGRLFDSVLSVFWDVRILPHNGVNTESHYLTWLFRYLPSCQMIKSLKNFKKKNCILCLRNAYITLVAIKTASSSLLF